MSWYDLTGLSLLVIYVLTAPRLQAVWKKTKGHQWIDLWSELGIGLCWYLIACFDWNSFWKLSFNINAIQIRCFVIYILTQTYSCTSKWQKMHFYHMIYWTFKIPVWRLCRWMFDTCVIHMSFDSNDTFTLIFIRNVVFNCPHDIKYTIIPNSAAILALILMVEYSLDVVAQKQMLLPKSPTKDYLCGISAFFNVWYLWYLVDIGHENTPSTSDTMKTPRAFY